MKEATLDQFSKQPQEFVKAAQSERVLVTQDGKPVAVVVGLENKDAEDWRLQTSPDFWQMIEARRGRPSVPLKDAERSLFPDHKRS
jgi:prevent-host-death family protein